MKTHAEQFGLTVSDEAPLTMDLETLMRGRLLMTASSGGGKTGALLKFCEMNSGKVQIIAIDPEGEFSVLRAKHPFVLVGPEGETPAMVRTAGILAHRLLELGASAILDIYELPMHEKHLFVKDFLDAMIAAPKNLWHPVVVIVDEAHMFAPEKGQGESVALGAMADLASRGRKRGYCAILATQRLAKLSKNVAGECQNVMIGRTTQIDQSRAADVLNIQGKAARDAFAREIGHMPTGDFYAYGMAFKSPEPIKFTVDRPVTMPKAGAKRLIVPPPPHEIQALLPKLSDLPAEAETKAKTEKDLRDEIKDLKRKLSSAPAPASTSLKPEREQMLLETINTLETNLAITKRTAGTYEKAMDGIFTQAGKMQDAAGEIRNIVANARQTMADAPAVTSIRVTPTPRNYSKSIISVAPSKEPPTATIVVRHGDLSGPEQRVLDSLAWFERVGVSSPELPAVAFMAGYTVNGSFNNVRGKLRSRGYVEYLEGSVTRLTADGRALANPPNIEPSNEALHEAIMSRLDGPSRKVLRPLIDAYPKALNVEFLAEAAGYTVNGSFNNVRGRLRTLGLVRYEKGGMTAANSLLFPID